jgi:hypothetical protein
MYIKLSHLFSHLYLFSNYTLVININLKLISVKASVNVKLNIKKIFRAFVEQ